MSNFKNVIIQPNELNMLVYAGQGDIGSIIAMQKLLELRHVIALANYAINKAINEADNFVKFTLYRSAILDYNSCFDYVRQIVYFGFDFCPLIKTQEQYIIAMKDWCQYRKTITNENDEQIIIDTPFKIKIEELKKSDANAKEFFGRLNKFRKELLKSSANITEWANTIKHRGGFVTNEIIDKSKIARIITTDSTGKHLFDSSFTLTSISFNEIETKLLQQNTIIISFIDYLQEAIFGNTSEIDDISASNKIFSAEEYDKSTLIGNTFLTSFETNVTEQDK